MAEYSSSKPLSKIMATYTTYGRYILSVGRINYECDKHVVNGLQAKHLSFSSDEAKSIDIYIVIALNLNSFDHQCTLLGKWDDKLTLIVFAILLVICTLYMYM